MILLKSFKNKSFQNALGIVILISVFAYMYLGWRERENSLKKIVYVRVKIDSINISMKGGPFFFYRYKINNVSYQDSQTISGTTMIKESNEAIKDKKGKYFYLKVSKEKPNYNELLVEYKVVDTTLLQPERGWNVLPEKIKSKYVKVNIFGDEQE